MNDTAMRLFSDTQDEDQRRIADLIVERMEKQYPPKLEPSTATGAALTGNCYKSLQFSMSMSRTKIDTLKPASLRKQTPLKTTHTVGNLKFQDR